MTVCGFPIKNFHQKPALFKVTTSSSVRNITSQQSLHVGKRRAFVGAHEVRQAIFDQF